MARLKATAAMVAAIEPAVALYEEPPTGSMLVETPWTDLWLGRPTGRVLSALLTRGHLTTRRVTRSGTSWWTILLDQVDEEEVPHDQLRRALRQNVGLTTTLTSSWPLIEPADLVGDLWDVPAYLRRCAPWLTRDEVRTLQREDPQAWTVCRPAAARRGPPAPRRPGRLTTATTSGRPRSPAGGGDGIVVDHLIASDDTEMHVMSMLRGDDLTFVLVDETAQRWSTPTPWPGPFAHVVVDEAQELTDAEWQMLLVRCPSRSFTIVGDRAQARHGFTESWQERLERVGLHDVTLAGLTINYRTPRR